MAGKTWKLPPLPPKLRVVPPKTDFVSSGAGAEVFRTIGASSLIETLLQLPQIAKDAAGREMSVILHEVIVDAKDNFVPVDTGDLRDTGDSDEYVIGSNAQVTELAAWFAAEATEEMFRAGVRNKEHDPVQYALEQHESLELNHPHGGGAKYLERPFTNKIPDIIPRLANAIGEALEMNGSFVNLAINDGPVTLVDPDFGAK